MSTKVFMEALSPTMEEGRLVKWLKNEGDAVKSGEVLAEVETDKAIMELVARGDGILRKRLIPEGESRPVGQLVGVIAAPDENIDAMLAEAGAGAGAAATASAGAAQAAAPSQAAAPTREAAGASAVPRAPNESQGEAPTPPQQKVAAAPPPTAHPGNGGGAPRAAQPEGNGGVRSSPLARRLAHEQGLDLGQLRGSGPGGRIIKRDIEAAASAALAAPVAVRLSVPPQRAGDYQDVALTQIRKTIARRLSESIGPIPTFYLTAEFDLTRI